MSKKDKVVIKEAFIFKFNQEGMQYGIGAENAEEHIKQLEFENIKNAICVIVSEDNIAIDIDTEDLYPIIRRDKKGRVIASEDIYLGKPHVLILRENNWDEMSLIQQLLLKSKAKEVYTRYNKTNNNEKVLKIGEK